jgi:hypothetical protein
MGARIEQARTLRVEFSMAMTGGGETGAMSGAVRIKGKDRFKVEYEMKDSRREREPVFVMSDGRKVIARGGWKGPSAGSIAPQTLAAEMRRSFSLSILPLAWYAEGAMTAEHSPEIRVNGIKDGGRARVGDRDSRVIEYSIRSDLMGVGAVPGMPVKVYVDPVEKRPLKRETSFFGMTMTETFGAFAFDEDLPDSDFTWQSLRRLGRVRAEQLARSAELFGTFTGRNPRQPGELVRRPGDLEPGVFWPEGGFLLDGVLPADPWGRPFEFRIEGGRLEVVGLGADGKSGGQGDDEDVAIPVPPATHSAVGAPAERLQKQFTARVQIHLLAAAIRGFRDAYDELPRKKAVLWERPEWAAVWPDGGWVPEGKLPVDPWGRPYRIISDPGYVRVQVRDPKAVAILPAQITQAEQIGLREVARPRFTEAERRDLEDLLGRLADDDLEVREKAESALKAWGGAIAPLLEERTKVEKDAEARSRLQALKAAIPARRPAWSSELGALAMGVGAGGAPGSPPVNERTAAVSLKTLASAEADFRANDRDGNQVNDFWTGDVAGLYTVKPAGSNEPIKLIDLGVAAADAAPLGDGEELSQVVEREAKGGYYFRVMTQDNSGSNPEPYQKDTGGRQSRGKVYHPSQFGFCAYPAEYGVTGTRTYIINEGNTVFWKDTQGEPILEWPSDDVLKEWRKLD